MQHYLLNSYDFFLYQLNLDLLILYVKLKNYYISFYLTEPHNNFFKSEKFQEI